MWRPMTAWWHGRIAWLASRTRRCRFPYPDQGNSFRGCHDSAAGTLRSRRCTHVVNYLPTSVPADENPLARREFFGDERAHKKPIPANCTSRSDRIAYLCTKRER